MEKELVNIVNLNPLEVFGTDKGLDPVIEEIKARVKGEVFDVSTEEGRARIGSVAKKIGSAKVTLEKMALELTEDWRAKTSAVNAEKKRMKEELDDLRDEVKAPLEEYKNREKMRIEAYEQRIEAMKNTANFDGFEAPDSKEMKEAINTLEKLHTVAFDNTQQEWEEFAVRAREVYEVTLERLKGMLNERVKYEAEQAELERLRDEKYQREKKEREDRIKQDAADLARKEEQEKAAREAKEAADKAQRDKDEAEAKAKADAKAAADKAEADKKAAIEKERSDAQARKKAEADEIAKREADKNHRRKINNDILSALVDIEKSCLQDKGDVLKEIVKSLVKNEIPHVKILY